MKIQEINGESRFQSKEYIKKRKKIKKRIFWIKFILISTLLITSIILLALSPIFNIKIIEVDGGQHYNKTEIIKATNLIIGENGFKTIGNSIGNLITFRYGLEEKNLIKKFPYFKSVSVKFILPDKIKISIAQRQPIAYINYNGNFLLIDNEAYVVDKVASNKLTKIPEIKGMKFQDFKLGQVLDVQDKQSISIFNKVYNGIIDSDKTDNYKVFKELNYIDVSDFQRIIVYIDSRVRVNLGDIEDLDYRIDFMKKSLLAMTKGDKGFLDMTLDKLVLKSE